MRTTPVAAAAQQVHNGLLYMALAALAGSLIGGIVGGLDTADGLADGPPLLVGAVGLLIGGYLLLRRALRPVVLHLSAEQLRVETRGGRPLLACPLAELRVIRSTAQTHNHTLLLALPDGRTYRFGPRLPRPADPPDTLQLRELMVLLRTRQHPHIGHNATGE